MSETGKVICNALYCERRDEAHRCQTHFEPHEKMECCGREEMCFADEPVKCIPVEENHEIPEH